MTDRAFSDPAIQRYLAAKDVMVLAMLGASGGPLATPMWFVTDQDSIGMVSVDGLAKIRNLERDPRVSLVAEGGDRGAINGVVLNGEVGFVEGEERLEWGRRFHHKYMPDIERLWGSSAIPDNRRVFVIQPRVISAFGID